MLRFQLTKILMTYISTIQIFHFMDGRISMRRCALLLYNQLTNVSNFVDIREGEVYFVFRWWNQHTIHTGNSSGPNTDSGWSPQF